MPTKPGVPGSRSTRAQSPCPLTRFGLIWLLLILSVSSARAFEVAEVAPPPGARLPLSLPFQDAAGRRMTIGEALNGRPAVLVFADWTCSALCGTTIGQAAMVLREARLRPGDDYAFLVIGIDPRDTPRDAAEMKALHLADAPALRAASHFLSGDAASVRAATEAVGFHSVYLPELDQFSHPAALLLLGPDGRLSKVLPSFMLEPEELRSALRDAVSGVVPAASDTLVRRVLLICHAVLAGKYGTWVPDALRAAGAATVLCMVGAFVLMTRRGRRG
ncbi:MAG: SCO family protein [Acetobacteraceae bacterium]